MAADRQLTLFKRAYDATKNPLFVWRAYLRCAELQMPAVDWIEAYLVRVAGRFDELAVPSDTRATPREKVSAVFDALKMEIPVRQGPGDPLSEDGRDLVLAVEVQSRLDGPGRKQKATIGQVARHFGVSVSTVHRAWKQYEGLLGDSQSPEI